MRKFLIGFGALAFALLAGLFLAGAASAGPASTSTVCQSPCINYAFNGGNVSFEVYRFPPSVSTVTTNLFPGSNTWDDVRWDTFWGVKVPALRCVRSYYTPVDNSVLGWHFYHQYYVPASQPTQALGPFNTDNHWQFRYGAKGVAC